jgi:hypothetical protein
MAFPSQPLSASIAFGVVIGISRSAGTAGVSMFPGEQVRLSRRWAETRFADLRYFGEAASGGHFAAMENPAAFVEHVRVTFRGVS